MDAGSTTRAGCGREDLERHLREVAFAASDDPDLVGLEIELIPLDAATGRALPMESEEPGGRASGPFLRAVGRRHGWTESVSRVGAPALLLPEGGQLSFEPGGQLEYSSPPYRSVDRLAERIDGVLERVAEVAREEGIALLARGFDPEGPVERARLRIRSPRYERMARHYARRGVWGRRMMCQSAAVHVNVDLGDDPLRRWRVLRRAVPGLLAAFANSPRAEACDTGHRSWRAAQWRRLDPTRTGLPGAGPDPVASYLDFALGAELFVVDGGAGAPTTLGEWLGRGISVEDVHDHLTTLFPEVRPRGYLEVRCFDGLPPPWYVVPAVLCMGLLYDPDALRRADDELPEVGRGVLEQAGREGVRDPLIREAALRVFELALTGAEALPDGIVGTGAVRRAREYRERFTAAGRDPGDEPPTVLGAPLAGPAGG